MTIINSVILFSTCLVYSFIYLGHSSSSRLEIDQPENDNLISVDTLPNGPVKDYASSKSEILDIKYHTRNNSLNSDSLSCLFTDLLVNKLIPHWLGTPWSFEGHTSVPRQGEIACGYFVSTTLQHMGFNFNRYKFAQQLPINEAKTLSLGDPVVEIYSNSIEDRIRQLNAKLKEGIYFIGFDRSHVGYIQKSNGQLLLIHSNYINADGVVIEKIEDSQVFSYYTRIYIAEISNKELLKKWLLNESIQVHIE